MAKIRVMLTHPLTGENPPPPVMADVTDRQVIIDGMLAGTDPEREDEPAEIMRAVLAMLPVVARTTAADLFTPEEERTLKPLTNAHSAALVAYGRKSTQAREAGARLRAALLALPAVKGA